MNVFADFAARLRSILEALAAEGAIGRVPDLARVVVEPPRDPSHGDLATNAALALSKELGVKPRDLAEKIAAKLAEQPDVAATSVAGPGFVNLTLTPAYLHGVLGAALAAGLDYGKPDAASGTRVNVEYVSANPTGPMHVGHCRGAVFGDSLASLLAFAGEDVTREYYINDAGAQVDVLARSAFLRYREALGEEIGAVPEGLYPGDYLKPVGQTLAQRFGPSLLDTPEADWLPTVKNITIDAMMAMIRDDLAALNIRHDVFFSERTLHGPDGPIVRTVEELKRQGLVYEGVLAPPKGELPDDWEEREQTLFRATEFGDDVDRPLMKSDRSYTYFAADVAYFRSKFERGFREMVFVLGADHGGYVKRLEAVGRALSGGTAKVSVELCQLVRLFRAGEPVRMSKRAGDFVTLRDVVDEVGRDAVRFMMLFRSNDAVLDFDFAKVTEQSRDNPVFYVQYAHARAQSILRKGAEVAGHDGAPDLALLTDPGELDLIKRLAQWPRIVEQAAQARQPHRVAFYLHDLASDLHAHWNRGKDSPDLRFIMENNPLLTCARLALVRALALVLAAGLGILGVAAPDEMR
ncbi:arginyl-tRNA synthetase [Methylopila capsulata]|uniref:Arginine--tRNA ligase n=1 Tax=Methylopila capsulata TaxID=61654 RepID=A0A9W6MRX5_9HYPH|nr:arginine--tRNA ligase [Methylopila capsulata]MBM7850414.1 arginyl-tRNA synthetase [Methylopila capsulata]GLK55707.1 arginine--tRNA ligase [Methylopila capsulata]